MVLPADRHGELLAVLVDRDGARAHDARPAHAARDHRRVARLAADRGQNALGDVHAVNVVGRGFLADQNHRTAAAHLDGVFGGEGGASDGGARATPRFPSRSCVSFLSDGASNTGCRS